MTAGWDRLAPLCSPAPSPCTQALSARLAWGACRVGRSPFDVPKTTHVTPKGQVDSEVQTGWIQVDSSGFGWIRTLLIAADCAPVWVLSMWAGGFSATAPTLYNIKKENESLGK